MIKRASAFIAYGTNARDYLLSSGADPNRIWISINTVDTEYFKEETVKLRKLRATVTRKKRLIYIGELSPRKNVVKVLDVVKALAISRDDFLLDIVGDGEERLRLEKYVIDNNLAKFVIFHGHKQKADMPALLACADCFLFQTDFDIWGLVLVEAMAAGLPCLSSVNAGATYDLIDDGVTGFAVDFAETEKIAKKINWIMDNPEEAHQIGETACKWACEKASLFEAARGFVSAISYVANR
ncbi:MAG: glycosyltransferase family 4 protein [Nitrospirae bacterium]|nr:glycosyltransferase family 4 protein [Nitrospirota bacterium]